MFRRLTREVERLDHPPFDHVVVDEAQDVSVAQLRFLAAFAILLAILSRTPLSTLRYWEFGSPKFWSTFND